LQKHLRAFCPPRVRKIIRCQASWHTISGGSKPVRVPYTVWNFGCGPVRRGPGAGRLRIVDCGPVRRSLGEGGLNGEATTEQISPRRPQRTQRGTWGKAKRQRTRRREGRGRREPQTRSRQPCEALKGRKTIAQWREPWESKAPAPLLLSSFS